MLLNSSSSAIWSQYVIVDLTACGDVDGFGLKVLSMYQRERGNLIVVVPPEHPVMALISATQLENFLTVVESVEFAIEFANFIPDPMSTDSSAHE